MLKKILIASLVVIFVNTLAFAFQRDAPWERFNSPEGNFNILMPSKPAIDLKDVDTAVGTLKLHLFSASTDTGYFLVSYGDYPSAPADLNDAESVLNGVRDGIVNGSTSELVSEKKISLYSYPGREIVTKKATQGDVIVFKWRIYLVGRRLYQIAVGTTQKDAEMPDVNKFLTSFDLNK